MENIEKILVQRHTSILFLAPPAWGKTYKLLNLIKNSSLKWVFVSPLKALTEEVYAKALSSNITTSKMNHENLSEIKHFQCIVGTAESFCDETLTQLRNRVFIIDEFHLFYYWGESFRYRLREFYENLASKGISYIALTATMNARNIAQWKQENLLNYDQSYIINIGNQTLLNSPKSFVYYPKWSSFQFDLDPTKCNLIFSPYRGQVIALAKHFERQGLNVIYCIGGEVDQFVMKLRLNPNPQLIISTSCLSHGVNLPQISRIFIPYKVENLDLWIQMVARGGRRGEDYTCYTRESSYLNLWQKVQGLCLFLWISFRQRVMDFVY